MEEILDTRSLNLPPDLRYVLKDLSRESGQAFFVRDGGGRVAVVSNGNAGVGADPVRLLGINNVRRVMLPSGEDGFLGIVGGSGSDPVTDAWLRAATCLVSSVVRLAMETENMAAEIARAYEELSMLYSSSSTLSAAEDSRTACDKTLALAMSLIDARRAAIYLRNGDTGPFKLAAGCGPEDSWAQEVTLEAPANSFLHGGHSVMLESAGEEELASIGAQVPAGMSLLAVPLNAEMGVPSGVTGWLVLCDRNGHGPFVSNDEKAARALASQAGTAISNARLVEERQVLLMGTIRSLASAVDAKDRYTHGHSLRVTEYALCIARQMNCKKAEVKALELSGLLHDVGKIGVPDVVLSKPGALSEEEWVFMRKHPVIGAGILEAVPSLHPYVRQGVRSHHERFDGAGYPDRLGRYDIPVPGRILSVADCFDAMTSDRPYRKGMDPEVAVQTMLDGTGKQFDPDMMGAFLEVWTSGQLAVTTHAPALPAIQ